MRFRLLFCLILILAEFGTLGLVSRPMKLRQHRDNRASVRNHDLPSPPCSAVRHSSTLQPCTSFSLSKMNQNNPSSIIDYNDDAFGLVFLCGVFVAQDFVFSICFLLSSATAAIAIRQNKIIFTNHVPAAVAGMSFVVANIFSSVMVHALPSTPSWLSIKSESAIRLELAVCSISVLYGFVISPVLNKEEKKWW